MPNEGVNWITQAQAAAKPKKKPKLGDSSYFKPSSAFDGLLEFDNLSGLSSGMLGKKPLHATVSSEPLDPDDPFSG